MLIGWARTLYPHWKRKRPFRTGKLWLYVDFRTFAIFSSWYQLDGGGVAQPLKCAMARKKRRQTWEEVIRKTEHSLRTLSPLARRPLFGYFNFAPDRCVCPPRSKRPAPRIHCCSPAKKHSARVGTTPCAVKNPTHPPTHTLD